MYTPPPSPEKHNTDRAERVILRKRRSLPASASSHPLEHFSAKTVSRQVKRKRRASSGEEFSATTSANPVSSRKQIVKADETDDEEKRNERIWLAEFEELKKAGPPPMHIPSEEELDRYTEDMWMKLLGQPNAPPPDHEFWKWEINEQTMEWYYDPSL